MDSMENVQDVHGIYGLSTDGSKVKGTVSRYVVVEYIEDNYFAR